MAKTRIPIPPTDGHYEQRDQVLSELAYARSDIAACRREARSAARLGDFETVQHYERRIARLVLTIRALEVRAESTRGV